MDQEPFYEVPNGTHELNSQYPQNQHYHNYNSNTSIVSIVSNRS